MGESVNAVTLPGSTKLSTGAPCFGGGDDDRGRGQLLGALGQHVVGVHAAAECR